MHAEGGGDEKRKSDAPQIILQLNDDGLSDQRFEKRSKELHRQCVRVRGECVEGLPWRLDITWTSLLLLTQTHTHTHTHTDSVHSPSVSVCLSLCLCLSPLSLSLCLSLCLSLSLSVSLSPSLSSLSHCRLFVSPSWLLMICWCHCKKCHAQRWRFNCVRADVQMAQTTRKQGNQRCYKVTPKPLSSSSTRSR